MSSCAEPVVRAWSFFGGARGGAAWCWRGRLTGPGGKGLLGGVPFGPQGHLRRRANAGDLWLAESTLRDGGRQATPVAAALPKAAGGGILLGKTITTEFANRQPGPTREPARPGVHAGRLVERLGGGGRRFYGAIGDRDPGPVARSSAPPVPIAGSSSVQAELWPVPARRHENQHRDPKHGRHHGAAGRRHPALFRAAVMANSIRSAGDAADGAAAHSGLCRGPHWDDAEPEGRAVLEAAADRLAGAGAKIADTAFPPECAAADDIQQTLGAFEGCRNHMPELYRHEAFVEARGCARKRSPSAASCASTSSAPPIWPPKEARAVAREWASARSSTQILTLPAPGQAAPTARRLAGRHRLRRLQRAVDAIRDALPDLPPPGMGRTVCRSVSSWPAAATYDARVLEEVGLWVEHRLGRGGQP